MSDEPLNEREREYQQRYLQAAHAMQSGVKYDLETDPSSGTAKHLRVGVNSAMVDHGALAELLVAKGLITREEYLKALAEKMEAEVRTYQDKLTERMGAPVRLA